MSLLRERLYFSGGGKEELQEEKNAEFEAQNAEEAIFVFLSLLLVLYNLCTGSTLLATRFSH